MTPEHIKYLCCPKTEQALVIDDAEFVGGRVCKGNLRTQSGKHKYPISNFIPRFVQEDYYASNFSHEWNLHSKTQYDIYTNSNLSAERFRNETKWPENLSGEIILEAGSGSGRFTEQALNTGAMVVSFDLSKAVEANFRNNGHRSNLLLLQADIFNMPFRSCTFDKVLCIGVLQHTPDPRSAFACLVEVLKSGGSIVADNYLKSLGKYWLQPKYWIRPLTKRVDPEKLYSLLKAYVDFMWPLSKVIRRIPLIGPTINWKLLIADYSRELPHADDQLLKEWAHLDTFDMLSPAYDFPVTISDFEGWFREEGLQNIDVCKGYNGVQGRATKP